MPLTTDEHDHESKCASMYERGLEYITYFSARCMEEELLCLYKEVIGDENTVVSGKPPYYYFYGKPWMHRLRRCGVDEVTLCWYIQNIKDLMKERKVTPEALEGGMCLAGLHYVNNLLSNV